MVSQHSGTTSDDINQTKNFIQFCRVGNQIEDCKLGLFQDASFAGDLRDLKFNVRRFTVRIWTTHVCSNFVDVQFLTAMQSLIF